MVNNVIELNVNEVETVEMSEMAKQMMQGYVEMALINKQICNEEIYAEEQAHNTLESFLGN